MMFVILSALLLSVTDLGQCTANSTQIPEYMTIHKVIGNWEEAYLQCKSEGAVLASPINTTLLNVMKSLIGVNNTPYLIGTRASDNSRSFISVEGVLLEKMNGAALAMIRQLDPEEGSCLSMDQHSIRAVPCWSRLPFICYNEQLYRCNLTMERTESDGERTEVIPNEKSVRHDTTCAGQGYKYENLTGSCYKLHAENSTWDDAAITCVSEGAHLVVIDDDTEAQVVRNMGIKQTFTFTYIGLRFYIEENEWRSVNGKRIEYVYHDWHSGNPTGVASHCVMIRPTGKIDNYACHFSSNFICEKPPHNK